MVYFLLCFLSVMLSVYLFMYLGYIVGLTNLKVADSAICTLPDTTTILANALAVDIPD